ncbi:MAG: hypothetical protein L3K23_10695 [Thermoplasmata archaeon]|nr:hypothetical protein [Thermoplasmata archaeon]
MDRTALLNDLRHTATRIESIGVGEDTRVADELRDLFERLLPAPEPTLTPAVADPVPAPLEPPADG